MNRSIIWSLIVGLFALAHLSFDAQADEIYASGRTNRYEVDISHLQTIDKTTAVATDIGTYAPATTQVIAIAFEPDGTLLGIRNWINRAFAYSLVDIDLETGAYTVVSHLSTRVWALEIDADGTIYGATSSGQLCRIDRATGAVTAYGSGPYIVALAFDTAGTLWSTDGQSLYIVDPVTGTLTLQKRVTNEGAFNGMTFDGNNVLYMSTGHGSTRLVTVDLETGVSTRVGTAPYGANFRSLEWGPPAPEPSTLLDELMDAVVALALHKGTANSLTSKIGNASDALEDERVGAVVNKLRAFIREVEAQSGGKIVAADANHLVALAQEIIDILEAT